MAQVSEVAEQRFGNVRLPRSAGLWHFGMVGTALVMVAAVLWVITFMFVGLMPALGELVLTVPLTLWLTVPDRHRRTQAQKQAERSAARHRRRRGAHLQLSGPTGRVPEGRFSLPGILAATSLGEVTDAYGRACVLVHHHRLGRLTAVVETQPDGAALVDREDLNRRVGNWGAWHRSLPNVTGVLAVTATVETAPASASRLRNLMERRMARDVDVPAEVDEGRDLAKQIVRDVVEASPDGAALVRGWVALTYGISRPGRKRGVREAGVDIATQLPGLTGALQPTGAGVCRPCTAQRLCEAVRVAYDPGIAAALEDAKARGETPELRWSQVGPSYAQAFPDRYEHESGYSITWAMAGVPSEWRNNVLERLIAPHPDIDRKRITLVYRPIPPGAAARQVEKDVQNAEIRRQTAGKRRPSAQAHWDVRRAEMTADEHARGAALEDMGMLVTATVMDQERLPAAIDAIESAAGTIELRRLWHAQSLGFAAGLPLGIDLAAYVRTPRWLREGL